MSLEKITESDSYYNDLEYKSTEEIIKIINAEDKTVPFAIEKALPQIETLVEQVVLFWNTGIHWPSSLPHWHCPLQAHPISDVVSR